MNRKTVSCILLGILVMFTLDGGRLFAAEAQGALAGQPPQGLKVPAAAMKKEAPSVKKRESVKGVSRHGRWEKLGRLSSRGGFEEYPYLDMEATAYDPGPVSCGPKANGYTATGMKAGHGVIAVDPRVIPLGTKVYVEGYGYGIAADIGGAIQGNRIDLCFNTYREAIQYGRRIARVFLLGR